MEWWKQYGPIFYFSSLGEKIVVLSDLELIREAFSKVETTDRQSNAIFTLFYADGGLIFSSGELWKQSRALLTTPSAKPGHGWSEAGERHPRTRCRSSWTGW